MRAHRTLTTTAAVVTLAFLALLGTGTHTVTRGETLATIAARYGTTPSALARANSIANPNRILVGARLTVPTAAASPARAATASYTVRSGDTLGSIASRAGTSIAALMERNGLANANLIRVGQVLRLPAASAAAPPAVSAPAGGATHHVVRSGDTIGGVASRYGITQRQLIDANGLTGGMIYVGQRLRLIPLPNASPSGGAAATTHRVAAGQSLSSIAQRYGTTLRAIQAANGITDPNRVLVGAVLKIPTAGGGSTTLVCPVRGTMRFMNDWGFPRSGGRFHEGNDLFANRGTPAVALVAGNAVQTTGTLGGRQVKLLGDDGVSYYYMHLDSFGAAGRVAAGTVIGTVGSSGNAAGGPPHVHFEVHPGGGAAVNPFPRISPVC